MNASAERYDQVELADGTRRPLTIEEKINPNTFLTGARRFQLDNLIASEFRPDTTVSYTFEGHTYFPGANNHWKTSVPGLDKLVAHRRLMATHGNSLRYIRYVDDFAARPVSKLVDRHQRRDSEPIRSEGLCGADFDVGGSALHIDGNGSRRSGS